MSGVQKQVYEVIQLKNALRCSFLIVESHTFGIAGAL